MLRRSSSTSSPSVVPLDQLAPGSWAEVVRVQGPLRWRRRLSWLALRRQTARQIWVRPVAPRGRPPENGTPLSKEG